MSETVKDCNYPWTWMFVVSNGQVFPCCYAKEPLGNLNEASAEEIWNGVIAQDLRRHIKQDKLHPICDGPCKFAENTRKANGG